ncbi:hypothetical protein ID866_6126 [Astraeus odoratus]|nr:hypothetical protein ID866_6126 [Astraeus odoratus]
MHPTQTYRQQRNGPTFTERYWTNQPGRMKFVIAVTATVIGTTGAYYWAYRDVDRRHTPCKSD